MDDKNSPTSSATEATAPSARAHHAGDDGAVAGGLRRFSAKRKLAAVQRLMRGESLDAVSRDLKRGTDCRWQMKKYFINLKRVPERAKFMAQEASRIGLTGHQFFPAVDAHCQEIDNLSPLYTPQSWQAYWELSPTEVAVFESHRMLWEQCATENNGCYLICEDDIVLSKDLPACLLELDKYESEFDFIRLDSAKVIYRLGKPFDLGALVVAPILQPMASAAAYVVSPLGARKLATQARRGFCDHVDDFITRPQKNYRAFQLIPALAIQGMFAKPDCVPREIRKSERTSKTHDNDRVDRGPAVYRLGKEVRRVLRKLLRRVVLDRRLLKNGGSIDYIKLADDLPDYHN